MNIHHVEIVDAKQIAEIYNFYVQYNRLERWIDVGYWELINKK